MITLGTPVNRTGGFLRNGGASLNTRTSAVYFDDEGDILAASNVVDVSGNGSVFFFGFQSDSDLIKTIQISPNNKTFVTTLDNFVTELDPIPLPAALPLMGTGLAVLGFLGWRRRKAAA